MRRCFPDVVDEADAVAVAGGVGVCVGRGGDVTSIAETEKWDDSASQLEEEEEEAGRNEIVLLITLFREGRHII